jgi:hypothetical protein
MRDNKIHLPITVSNEAMVDDLKYYGFDNIDSITITMNLPFQIFYKQTKSIDDTYRTKMTDKQY